ncbi:MCE family protein [Nocardia sp. NPDC058640]|uniref:MCE family protein n=1 Tax=Nocardia sp. NPDC058640 TaxID=3346571 RepID=UPI0036560F0F
MVNKFRKRFDGNRNFWLGVIGAAIAAVLVAVASIFTALGLGKQSVEMEFQQAAGIRSGDRVAVSGVGVGTVKSAELDGDKVLVSVNIDGDIELKRNAHATIKMATLLGARYIELDPGDGEDLDGDRISVANTTVPYDLADVIQRGTPEFQELDTAKLAASLNAVNSQLSGSPELVAQALDSVGAVAKVIERRRVEVDQLLKDLSQVTTILGENRNSVLLVITQGEAIASRVMQRQDLLRQLLDSVATLTRQLSELGVDDNGQLTTTIDNLKTMSEGLQKNKDNLDILLSVGPPTARYLGNATGDGPYANLALPWLFPDNWLCAVDLVEGCQ